MIRSVLTQIFFSIVFYLYKNYFNYTQTFLTYLSFVTVPLFIIFIYFQLNVEHTPEKTLNPRLSSVHQAEDQKWRKEMVRLTVSVILVAE